MTDQKIYARQPAENRPTCPYCGEKCTAGSTQGGITNYYCRNDDCSITYSVKVPRPNIAEIVAEDMTEINFDSRK